ENGESWCVYDGYIGDGKDVPGSRHWKRMCIEGKVKYEPCADYRGQICTQYETEKQGQTLTAATCEINLAALCALSSGSDCLDNKDCMVKSVFIDKYFQFDQCVARYPRGFNLKETSEEEARLCSTADQTCIIFYRRDWKRQWQCMENCDCKTYIFAEKLNDVCISLGDCGSSVNYIGEGTNNIAVTGTDNIGWENYIKYSNPVEGQYAEPKENRTGSGSWSAWYWHRYDGPLSPRQWLEWIGKRTWYGFIIFIGWYIVIYIILWFFNDLLGYGWGDTKKYYVYFNCYPWQAPSGGEDCGKCNDDVLKPCSKYRCESLGQACQILNEDEENPICQAMESETVPPVISAGDILSIGYGFFNEQNKRVEIRTNISECIPEFTPVLFRLKTDEYAQCKFDLEPNKNYEEFMIYPIEGTIFSKEHSFAFSMPSLDSFSVYNVTGDIKEMFGNTNLYVKCIDYHGNINLKEYEVNFCINLGPDLTASRITYSEPWNHNYLKYNITESPLAIYINEPAECKYDIEDKDYNNMLNEMNCRTEIDDAEIYGWVCNTTLTGLVNDSNTIYIRCKDQPWKPAEEDKLRNINQESYTFTLHKTKYPLKIDSIAPQGEIEEGFEPIAIDLEVKTSGGVNQGESACYYSFSESEKNVLFLDTFSWKHKQKFDMMMNGDYKINIKCEDDVGNLAYGDTSFSLKIDSFAPVAVRVYKHLEKLKIITDEKAECSYDLNKCNFNFDNAKSMTTALSTEHIAEWNNKQTYYIKCKDVWGNTNPECAMIIKPSAI
ncbi:MAG: hypothetical protein KJ646_02440, partial [Nanoarchaeota archaeon]|nr:hypothetical protein [Nanoarchaeota archaeon]MBU4116194.1 hypothetical protein [Nanoarchaeota archaeon]